MRPLETLDQKRASYAWKCIKNISDSEIASYTSLVKSAASLIMNNGLMQTLVFLKAKAKENNSQNLLLNHICRWLYAIVFDKGDNGEFSQVMGRLYESSSDEYMQSTREAIALFSWLRQLADARKSMSSSSEVKE